MLNGALKFPYKSSKPYMDQRRINILICCTGSVAALKIPDIVARLTQEHVNIFFGKKKWNQIVLLFKKSRYCNDVVDVNSDIHILEKMQKIKGSSFLILIFIPRNKPVSYFVFLNVLITFISPLHKNEVGAISYRIHRHVP